MKNKHQEELLLSVANKVRRTSMLGHTRFLLLLLACALLVLLTAHSLKSRENPGSSAAADVSPAAGGYSIFHETMVDMPWPEVEKAAKQGAIVLLPTAVIEEHGPHMGCGIDTYGTYMTCKLARRELEARGIRTLIAPPFYWGINGTTHVFGGTFTVRPETMKAVLHDILDSLKSMGFTNIFNINMHGDGLHCVTIMQSIIEARKSLGINAYSVLSEEEVARYRLKGNEPFLVVHKSPPSDEASQQYLDIHAGGGETGIIAAFFPDQMDTALAKTLKPTKLTGDKVVEWLKDARRVTPLGYLGDPASFNAAEGKKYLEDTCKMIADSIERSLKKK
jgi:creatinine amidohydrolase